MNEPLEPMGLPEPIVKRREATWLYLIAVGTLAALTLLATVGGIWLAFSDKALPEALVALAGAAVLALSRMVGTENQ